MLCDPIPSPIRSHLRLLHLTSMFLTVPIHSTAAHVLPTNLPKEHDEFTYPPYRPALPALIRS